MPIGSIISLPFFLPFPERALDHSMHLYVRNADQHNVDVGYVDEEKKVNFFIWNGTSDDVAITNIDGTGETTGISCDTSAPDTVVTHSYKRVIFTVTQYGPIEFSAAYEFISSCTGTPLVSITGTRPLPIDPGQPLPITLDAAIAEVYSDLSTGNTFYDTLEFVETSSTESVLVVHSDEDLETPQGTFLACKFGCKHPETEGGIVGSLQITINFLPRDAQNWIFEKCRTGTGVTVYWRQYLGPNQEPDAYYPLPLDIVSVEQNLTGATITASFPMLTEMKFPRRIMTTAALPGGLT